MLPLIPVFFHLQGGLYLLRLSQAPAIFPYSRENMKYNTYTSTSVPFHSAVQTYIQVCDPLSMRYFF